MHNVIVMNVGVAVYSIHGLIPTVEHTENGKQKEKEKRKGQIKSSFFIYWGSDAHYPIFVKYLTEQFTILLHMGVHRQGWVLT